MVKQNKQGQELESNKPANALNVPKRMGKAHEDKEYRSNGGSPEEEVTTTTERAGKTDDEKHIGRGPQDEGYSWVICICSLLINFFVIGHNRCLYILLVDIKDEFQESQTTVSLILSAFSFCVAVSSMFFSNVALRIFPHRITTVVCAVCCSVSLLIASQAPNIIVYVLAYACRGLSAGVMFIMPVSMIGSYFKKRRGLASSIASMGMVTANIVFPQFTMLIRKSFGLRGALLILAGLEMQLIPLCMLLRPHSSYRKRRHKAHKARKQETDTSHSHEGGHNAIPMKLKDVVSVEIEPYSEDVTRVIRLPSSNGKLRAPNQNGVEKDAELDNKWYSTSAPARGVLDPGDSLHSSETSPAVGDDHTLSMDDDIDTNKIHTEEQQAKPLLPLRMCSYEEKSTLAPGEYQCGSSSSNNRKRNPHSTDEGCARRNSVSRSRRSIHTSQLSIADVSSLVDISYMITEDEEENSSDEDGAGHGDGEDGKVNDDNSRERPTCGQLCHFHTFFDLSLMRSWVCRMVVVYAGLCATVNLLTIYMPIIAVMGGLTKDQASLLLTIGGVTDLFTRPFVGWFADKNRVSKEVIIVSSLSAVVVVTQFGRFFTTFAIFTVYTIIVSMFGGVRQNLINPLVFENFGGEKAPRVVGLILPCTTLFMAANHPIFGAIVDTTGSFLIPLHYFGAIIALGAAVLLFKPVFLKWDKKAELDRQMKAANDGEE